MYNIIDANKLNNNNNNNNNNSIVDNQSKSCLINNDHHRLQCKKGHYRPSISCTI